MSKSIKQRKDELILALEAKKQEPVNLGLTVENKVAGNLEVECRSLLYTNGIKNERVLKAHVPRLASLPKVSIYSNLKFMLHLRTRLAEEGIPLADAETILEHVQFDMTDVNEDDDYIGQFALLYAEVLTKRYEALYGKDVTVSQFSSDNHQVGPDVLKGFDIMNVKLPPA